MDTSDNSPLDRELLAYNVRFMRNVLGFTQPQLAGLANVSLRSVCRVEKAEPVRIKTITKICKGMQADFTEMSTMKRMRNMKADDQPFILHHAEESVWYEHYDKRRMVPLENQHLIQEENERLRLGKLGLVTVFRSGLSFVMPRGPGIVFTEVYGPYETLSHSSVYKDWVTYCLRGEVFMTIGDETIHLKEGDAVGYGDEQWRQFKLVSAISSTSQVPLLLSIGASPVGKVQV